MVLTLYGRMSAAKGAGKDPGAWFIETNRISLSALTTRRSRARLDEEQTKSTRVAIVSSVFLVLFAAALLIGGHAAIDPILQSAVGARQSQGVGAVVYTMPDGIFCRRMSFDNVTAEITEAGIERCKSDIAGPRPHAARGFAWSAK
jgi:hypothetical protein